MGACATKPKVLGDKVRRRSRKRSSNYGNDSTFSLAERSSLKDEKRFTSFSNKEDIIVTPKEVEDIDSYIIAADHYVHHDELPSYDTDDDDLDNHDHNVIHLDSSNKDEENHIASVLTKAREEGKNDVVEEQKLKEELSGPTPTNELQQDHKPNKSSAEATIPAGLYSPPPYTSQNDVVAGVLVHHPDSPPPTENDAVEAVITPPPSYTSKNVVIESALKADGIQTLISSPISHHSSKDFPVVDPAGLCGPTQTHPVGQDHENKVEVTNYEKQEDVITTNMPSTFAF